VSKARPSPSRLALLALAALAAGPRPAAASVVTAAAVTQNALEDISPRASGGEIAWQEGISGAGTEIRLFDGTDIVLVTSNNLIDQAPRLSAGRLVWKQSSNALDCSIQKREGGSTTPVAASIPCVSEVRAAGPHVIWTDDANGALDDVFVRTDAGAPAQLGEAALSEESPRVGDVAGEPRAAWTGPGGDGLWYWDGTNAPAKIVNGPVAGVEMDGARVVWVASDGNDDEIFLYDGSTLTPVTDNDFDDAEPQVAGAAVAWTGYPDAPGEGEIYLLEGATTLRLTDDDLGDRGPSLSIGAAGPTVAWVKNEGVAVTGDEIWMYEGCEAVAVTDDELGDTEPSVDGNRVAWVQGGGSTSEIWAASVSCDELCGNGATDPGEECDDGARVGGDGCDENCIDELCGNQVVQSAAGEECDDGNTAVDDGCDACELECGNGGPNPGEECDDGNHASGDGCSDTCLAEICGNGRLDAGEVCDDGGTLNGDGCSATCSAEAPASKAHQKCINALNKLGAKLAAVQHKVSLECLDDAAEANAADLGNPPTAQDCLANDPDGKRAAAQAKTTSGEAAKCDAGDLPGFAYAGAAAVNLAGPAEAIALVADLFGADLTPAVIAEAADKAGARCQQDLLRSSQALSNLLFKLAVKEKKRRIAGTDGALAVSNQALELALLGYVQADARGKIGKKEAAVASTVTKRCGAVALATAFPGCAPADAAALASCASAAARCRFCRAFDAYDGLAMDCDVLDDANANGSCP
jgi:cysteine-rich repeat protein